MPEEVIDHRDFCQRLIEFLADCPSRNPITAVYPCCTLSFDSCSCLCRPRRARVARDVLEPVPPSAANPPIPAMNQHALAATISDLAVEVSRPFAQLDTRPRRLNAIFILSKVEEGS
jgi:hypothetical protein